MLGRALQGMSLEGYAVMRGVTLMWPVWAVARMLPPELSLGPQRLTPEGTHPVVMFFNDIAGAVMNVPMLLPPLNYRELVVGVPYAYASCGACEHGHGPMFFMPHMPVDNATVVAGARTFWGFNKTLASFVVGPHSYDLFDFTNKRLMALDFQHHGPAMPVGSYAHFAALRDAIDQPLVSRFPLAQGSCVAASAYDRRYHGASLRPLQGSVFLDALYTADVTRHAGPYTRPFRGIDESPLGGFELHTRWRLGMPFPVQALR